MKYATEDKQKKNNRSPTTLWKQSPVGIFVVPAMPSTTSHQPGHSHITVHKQRGNNIESRSRFRHALGARTGPKVSGRQYATVMVSVEPTRRLNFNSKSYQRHTPKSDSSDSLNLLKIGSSMVTFG